MSHHGTMATRGTEIMLAPDASTHRGDTASSRWCGKHRRPNYRQFVFGMSERSLATNKLVAIFRNGSVTSRCIRSAFYSRNRLGVPSHLTGKHSSESMAQIHNDSISTSLTSVSRLERSAGRHCRNFMRRNL